MSTPQTSEQREADRALVRHRLAYDRSECSNEWVSTDQLAQELADATDSLQASRAPLQRAAKCLLLCILALAAMLALALTWRLLA